MQWPQTSAISLSSASTALPPARTAPRLGQVIAPRLGQFTGSSLTIKHILFDRFEPVHRAANGGIVHTKMACDFLQGVNAGEESACHHFAAGGIGARLVTEQPGERAVLRPGDFPPLVQWPSRWREAFDEGFAAQEHRVAQRLPNTRRADTLGDEGSLSSLRLGALSAELPEHPIGLRPGGSRLQADPRAVTAPCPRRGLRNHPCPYRVQHHVP